MHDIKYSRWNAGAGKMKECGRR